MTTDNIGLAVSTGYAWNIFQKYPLTLQQLGHCFYKKVILLSSLFTMNVAFLHGIIPLSYISSQ